VPSHPAAIETCGARRLPGLRREILRVRHHSLFVPRDFDVSPYFEVVKPTLALGFTTGTSTGRGDSRFMEQCRHSHVRGCQHAMTGTSIPLSDRDAVTCCASHDYNCATTRWPVTRCRKPSPARWPAAASSPAVRR
jgi:hypothetical protein